MRNAPLFAWLLLALGVLTLAAGLLVGLGIGSTLHPLLASPGSGVVLLVSALALIASAAFPLVLTRLAAEGGRGG